MKIDKEFHNVIRDRKELTVRYDPKTEAIWCYSNPYTRPCYSMELLKSFSEVQQDVVNYFKIHDMQPKTPIKYFINASQTPEIYN